MSRNVYWVLYHIASGHAFFTGLIMVMLSVITSNRNGWLIHRLTGLLVSIGVVFIIVGAAPLPVWMYVAFGISLSFWAVSYFKSDLRKFAGRLTIATSLLLMMVELPFHLNPRLTSNAAQNVTVIGDSVTAGLGSDGVKTWPQLLTEDHNLQIQDISHVGETAASALKRAKQHTIQSELVIIEIGGNDVLGATSADKFATDLETLIAYLQREDRQLVMFELPLPPFFTAFGKHQRDIAARHGVRLIPKRYFYSIIGKPENTVDGVHLSQQGQDAMADMVLKIIQNPTK